jgi:hypothetical protein
MKKMKEEEMQGYLADTSDSDTDMEGLPGDAAKVKKRESQDAGYKEKGPSRPNNSRYKEHR